MDLSPLPVALEEAPSRTYQRLRWLMHSVEAQMQLLSKTLPEEHERRFFADLRDMQAQLTLQAVAQEREIPAVQLAPPTVCPGLVYADNFGPVAAGCGNPPAQGSRLCLKCIATHARYSQFSTMGGGGGR